MLHVARGYEPMVVKLGYVREVLWLDYCNDVVPCCRLHSLGSIFSGAGIFLLLSRQNRLSVDPASCLTHSYLLSINAIAA
jgi:hypothetical protein